MTTDRRRFLATLLMSTCAAPAMAHSRWGLDQEGDRSDRDDYDLDPAITYLNHASTGTTPRVVREEMVRRLLQLERNPWFHMFGGGWDEARDQVRREAATLLKARPAEVAITRNTTEAFQVLAQGLPLGPGDEVLFSSLNHMGASEAWRRQAPRRGYTVREFEIPLAEVAGLSVDEVVRRHTEQIREHTRVLVLPQMDNIVGLLHPVRAITAAARKAGVRWVAVDGAQTPGMIEVDPVGDGVDFFATSGHKWLQSPKGLGLFYLRAEVQDQVAPMIVTWGQKRWAGDARVFEDYGTRDVVKLLSFGDAIRYQQQKAAGRARRLAALTDELWRRCEAEAGLDWVSARAPALRGALISLRLDAGDATEVALALFEDHGVVVRPFQTEMGPSLRVSPNTMNDARDLERLFTALHAVRKA